MKSPRRSLTHETVGRNWLNARGSGWKLSPAVVRQLGALILRARRARELEILVGQLQAELEVMDMER